MKKVLTILLTILLTFAVGCTVQESEQSSLEADYSTEMSEQPVSAEIMADETVADEAVVDEAVDVEECEAMPIYSSVDELISAVQTEKQAKTASPEAESGDLESLSVLYAPANNIEGFQLKYTEVYPKQVFYYYVPEGEELPYFSWEKGIVISYFREPVTNENEFFAELGLTPDEMGIVYSAVESDMYLVQGDAGIYISVPESLNDYDTIRGLCEMERIEIP